MGKEDWKDSPVGRKILDLEKRVLKKDKPWYQRSNLMSVLALTVSIGLAGYNFFKDSADEIWAHRQELTSVISELTEIDVSIANELGQAAHASAAQTYAIRSLVNKRYILLDSATRLIDLLGPRVSSVEFAVLAASYAQIQDYERAEIYFKKIAENKDSPTQSLMGWSSLGNLNFTKGEKFFDKGRESFRKALGVIQKPQDLPSQFIVAKVYMEWGWAELYNREYKKALDAFIGARNTYLNMPCIPQRLLELRSVETNIQNVFLSDETLAQAAEERLKKTGRNCPGDNVPPVGINSRF